VDPAGAGLLTKNWRNPKLRNYFDQVRKGFSFVVEKLWRFFVGGLIVVVGFLTNFIDLKQPILTAQIIGIEQNFDTKFKLKGNPELVSTNEIIRSSFADFFGMTTDNKLYSLEDLERELQNKWPDISYQLEKMKSSIDQKRVDESNRRKELFDRATSELRKLRATLESTETQVTITLAVANQGDGSTSIKPQGILRAVFAPNNYYDIELKMNDYRSSNASILPRSSNVFTFVSSKVKEMSFSDQQRFLQLTKTSSPTTFYFVDVYDRYYKSNTISFADGVYERSVFDSLKGFASK